MSAREEIYLEFIKVGHQVKVTAIDPPTGEEVSIIAPATASQNDMSKVAVDKLKRRLRMRDAGMTPEEQQNPRRRGVYI
ncbi:MAG: serine hydroxymethyltransferase [Pseudomonadota bacterium]